MAIHVNFAEMMPYGAALHFIEFGLCLSNEKAQYAFALLSFCWAVLITQLWYVCVFLIKKVWWPFPIQQKEFHLNGKHIFLLRDCAGCEEDHIWNQFASSLLLWHFYSQVRSVSYCTLAYVVEEAFSLDTGIVTWSDTHIVVSIHLRGGSGGWPPFHIHFSVLPLN